MTESVVDRSNERLIWMCAGIVTIRRSAVVGILVDLPNFLAIQGFTTEAFSDAFFRHRSVQQQCDAIALVKRALVVAERELREPVGLGQYINERKVNRIVFGDARWGQNGTIVPTGALERLSFDIRP